MTNICPFNVGDRVMFWPDQHTVGWYQQYWPKFRIKPGDTGTVTRTDSEGHVWLDDERGGFHWRAYKLAEEQPAAAGNGILYDGPNAIQKLSVSTPVSNRLMGGIDEFFSERVRSVDLLS